MSLTDMLKVQREDLFCHVVDMLRESREDLFCNVVDMLRELREDMFCYCIATACILHYYCRNECSIECRNMWVFLFGWGFRSVHSEVINYMSLFFI